MLNLQGINTETRGHEDSSIKEKKEKRRENPFKDYPPSKHANKKQADTLLIRFSCENWNLTHTPKNGHQILDLKTSNYNFRANQCEMFRLETPTPESYLKVTTLRLQFSFSYTNFSVDFWRILPTFLFLSVKKKKWWNRPWTHTDDG